LKERRRYNPSFPLFGSSESPLSEGPERETRREESKEAKRWDL